MPTGGSPPLRNMRERKSWFTEQVSEVENRLWACIHSRGVLDKNVKDLYLKACCIYEKLFLSENELRDLQNIEYLLWRLQYKHIDEFRRMISQSSAKAEENIASNQKKAANTVSISNSYTDNFRLFLSDATKFYQQLIRKIKTYYGLLDEPWFYKSDKVSACIEQTKLHNCQFVCHRLCICLGDLARYIQLYEKPNDHQKNWSVAASYYLEAAKIYPDGGNPQNQLAVLARYIGDEFLALYHCIRSLAVREPFPDALQNLVMLFEKNRSSNIVSLTDEVHDFLKPDDWIFKNSKEPINGTATNCRTSKVGKPDKSATSELWSLFIRMTSFFFLDSSLDGFACTFTSTLRELEALLALDVTGLSSALESYQNMNLSKAGPYRTLHIISVLLFAVDNLTGDLRHQVLRQVDDGKRSVLVKLALAVTFTFMGRLVDRCLKGSPVMYFPLLPALLVFVEWLVGSIEKLDDEDEKCCKAMCYFFCSLVKLLNYLQENRVQTTSPADIALWEDYELRGFIPMYHTHGSLDFSSHWEEEINYKMKNEYRSHRIVQAAIKIAGKSSDIASIWINYDEATRKFHTIEAKEFTDRKEAARKFLIMEAKEFADRKDSTEQKTSPDLVAKESHQLVKTLKATAVDEEEDIVFKPIARQNSEPIKLNDRPIAAVSNEHLRRASSLLAEQTRASFDSFTFHHGPSSSSCNQPEEDEFKQKGSPPSRVSEGYIAAGPPSLSSWVLNGDRFSSDGVKSRETDRRVLSSIQEISPTAVSGVFITIDDTPGIAAPLTRPFIDCSSSPLSPSSPHNAVWFPGSSFGSDLQNTVIHEPVGFWGSAYPSGIQQGGLGVSNMKDQSALSLATPEARPCSNPQFPKLGNHNPQLIHDHGWQDQYYVTSNVNSQYGSGSSGFGLLDHWSFNDPLASLPGRHFKVNPPLFQPSPSLLHGLQEQRKGLQIPDYQNLHLNVSSAVSDSRPEPSLLLQYLKQRELQIQQDSQFLGGGSYMQN